MLALPLLLLLLNGPQGANPNQGGPVPANDPSSAAQGAHNSPPLDRTLPAPGARVLATVQGRGVQIYSCALNQGNLRWTLQGPEATLMQADAQPIGTHAAGPSWHWNDGSAIAGNIVASTPSQQAGNVPSLLVEAFPIGNTRGFLSRVLWVRRSGATGGVAPAEGCDSAHTGTTVRVPYAATYTFYGSASMADM